MSTNNGLEWLSDRPKVHYGDCWREHHNCAIKEIERLQEEIQHLKGILIKYELGELDGDDMLRVSISK